MLNDLPPAQARTPILWDIKKLYLVKGLMNFFLILTYFLFNVSKSKKQIVNIEFINTILPLCSVSRVKTPTRQKIERCIGLHTMNYLFFFLILCIVDIV